MLTEYYVIHNIENKISFLSLEAAEDYIFDNYRDRWMGKDSYGDLCESMIAVDTIKRGV